MKVNLFRESLQKVFDRQVQSELSLPRITVNGIATKAGVNSDVLYGYLKGQSPRGATSHTLEAFILALPRQSFNAYWALVKRGYKRIP